MNRYVKLKYKDRPYLSWFHYVDENYVWSDSQIVSENKKSVEYAKMAFLDHGDPLIPVDDLSVVLAQKAAYLTPAKGIVFLIGEGGNFMTLLPEMEITEETYSEFYPVIKDSAVVCENDTFDKWRGGLDHVFLGLAKAGGADSFHYMLNFRSRTEEEIIAAFKNTPAIIFWSSYKEADWWELMIRCIIKSKTTAKVVGKKPSDRLGSERYEKCLEVAKKFGVNVIQS